MMRNNCQSPVRPCPQPNAGCPYRQLRQPGPVRLDSCSCSGFSKDQLLRLIATTGFACVDACLYLDTHPENTEAIAYFETRTECIRMPFMDIPPSTAR